MLGDTAGHNRSGTVDHMLSDRDVLPDVGVDNNGAINVAAVFQAGIDLQSTSPRLDGQVAGCPSSASVVFVCSDGSLGNTHLMDLVGAVGESGPPCVLIHVGERSVR